MVCCDGRILLVTFLEGLNGVNRQPLNGSKTNRQKRNNYLAPFKSIYLDRLRISEKFDG